MCERYGKLCSTLDRYTIELHKTRLAPQSNVVTASWTEELRQLLSWAPHGKCPTPPPSSNQIVEQRPGERGAQTSFFVIGSRRLRFIFKTGGEFSYLAEGFILVFRTGEIITKRVWYNGSINLQRHPEIAAIGKERKNILCIVSEHQGVVNHSEAESSWNILGACSQLFLELISTPEDYFFRM